MLNILKKFLIPLALCITLIPYPFYAAISAQTKAIYNRVCGDFNIRPNNLTLVDSALYGPAATDGSNVYIDQNTFNYYSAEAQYFVIGHELSHYQEKDHLHSSVESTFHTLADAKSDFSFTHNHARELRADITSMLKGPQYAKGAVSVFQSWIDQGETASKSKTHPSNKLRLEIAKKIVALYAKQKKITLQQVTQALKPSLASA